ncbi:MAG: alkaline shock response membrane anchor protein AmaP [Bacillota bacterium]
MNPFDRGLMVLYALAGTLTVLVLGAALAGWAWPVYLLRNVAEMPGFIETSYALLVIFFLAGIRLAWQGLRSEKRHAVVQEGPLGQVRIALAAIESLVEKVVLDQKGVKEAKAAVEAVPTGLGIRVRASVVPDINIPRVSEILQNTVREKVLEVAGIEVKDIRISVDHISAQKLRVE